MTPGRISGVTVALSLAATLSAQGPSGSLRGRVSDRDFDTPLAAAQVSVSETGAKAQTSAQGDYVLSDLRPGKYTLIFAKDGYVRQVRSDVVIAAGRMTELNVALSGDFTDMEEFVVQDLLQLGGGTEQGLLQLRFDSPALLDSISAEWMDKAGASDAAGALRLVAGATVKDGKSAVIRGLPDRYVSSQMNGVRLPSADEDKRAVELDQFPSAVIESIQVSKTFTPDQQGDASGGAVNVRLQGIPDQPFFIKYKGETSYNSQVTGRGRFLTYDGGGVHYTGQDTGAREIQSDRLGDNWLGAVGVSRGEAPIDYKGSLAVGGMHEFDGGLRIGGFASVFYERDSSFFDKGVDDSYWVEQPGGKMTPKAFQGSVQDGDFKTALYDVSQGSQSVQLGDLATLGVATEHHAVNLVHLYTRTAEDTATLAEDTRGKKYFFPDYDIDDVTSSGHEQPDGAPYLRLETLEYTERTTETLQLSGRHAFPTDKFGGFHSPELDWTVSRSTADLYQPDKRQFGSQWTPNQNVGPVPVPPTHRPFKPAANFTLGNLQRIWKSIDEESEQYAVNLELPFEQWSRDKGYLKFGVFHDKVERKFDQNSFSNFGDNSSYTGGWRQSWSRDFPLENHPITESLFDVDYRATQEISAVYGMIDLPITSSLSLVGGVRYEDTGIDVTNDPERDATWFPPGSTAPVSLKPGDADVSLGEQDRLHSIGLIYTPVEEVTLRASYNETLARPTFKELTPILQQEFLGGPIFIGNPELLLSSLRNYDLRVDWTPYEGGLFSASWFQKDIKFPIEYVQRLTTFDFTTAINYPEGQLSGYEIETRHHVGHFWGALEGLRFGGNATLIDSEVTLPSDEVAGFARPEIRAPITKRDMTNAPEHLYNLFVTYDIALTGTQIGVFYTITGDTLLAGATQSKNNFVPSVYAKEYDALNLTVTQRLGEFTRLQFKAKNLTDPDIETVYRSEFIGDDVTKTFFTRGVDYSISIGGEIRF